MTGCPSWPQPHAWDAISSSPKSYFLKQNSTTGEPRVSELVGDTLIFWLLGSADTLIIISVIIKRGTHSWCGYVKIQICIVWILGVLM